MLSPVSTLNSPHASCNISHKATSCLDNQMLHLRELYDCYIAVIHLCFLIINNILVLATWTQFHMDNISNGLVGIAICDELGLALCQCMWYVCSEDYITPRKRGCEW